MLLLPPFTCTRTSRSALMASRTMTPSPVSSMVSSPFRGLQLHGPLRSVLCSRVIHVTRCSSNPKGSNPTDPSLQESLDRSTKQGMIAQVDATSKEQSTDRSLASLFVFDGPAPETINGRMAMMGFVWALVAEKLTGLTVVEQLFNPSTSGLLWFSAVVQLFAFASIIPFANGQSTDERGWGPFNGKAERWNGRLAMLGFAALLLVEIVQQAPLIHI